MLGVVITADDVRYWPYSLRLLVKVKGNADWRSHVDKGVQAQGYKSYCEGARTCPREVLLYRKVFTPRLSFRASS